MITLLNYVLLNNDRFIIHEIPTTSAHVLVSDLAVGFEDCLNELEKGALSLLGNPYESLRIIYVRWTFMYYLNVCMSKGFYWNYTSFWRIPTS